MTANFFHGELAPAWSMRMIMRRRRAQMAQASEDSRCALDDCWGNRQAHGQSRFRVDVQLALLDKLDM
ncbi:hypothetical protein [uncultured Caballeronia sp.]|uniref:hypothetical protein n=1 Tax=uncultured Caballeronia sp. TaxID=1827198 RepID=UPI0035CA281B